MAAFFLAVATLGAPGNTARWAAHLYHRWVRLTPDDPLDMSSLLTALIATRYDVDALIHPEGCSPGIRAALNALHGPGSIRSLCHAIILILPAESDFGSRPAEEKEVLVEVVGLELIRMGVLPELALGEDLHACPSHLCAAYRQSIWMLRLLLAP